MECRHQVALFTPGELKSVTSIQQQRGYKLEHVIHYYQLCGGGAQAKQNPEARQSGRHEGLSPHPGLLVVKETDSVPPSQGQPGLPAHGCCFSAVKLSHLPLQQRSPSRQENQSNRVRFINHTGMPPGTTNGGTGQVSRRRLAFASLV